MEDARQSAAGDQRAAISKPSQGYLLTIKTVAICSLCVYVLSGCGSPGPRQYEEVSGRLVCKSYPYSVEKLPADWSDHPQPNPQCVMFFGKGRTQVHIGMFVYENANSGDEQMQFLTKTDDDVKRDPAPPFVYYFGKIPYYTCIVTEEFKSPGGAVKGLLIVAMVELGSNVVVFTYKRRIDHRNQEEISKIWNDEVGPDFRSFVASLRHEKR